MKIAFLTRIDAFDKNGGDTYQIEMYQKYLEKMGHSVEIITDLTIPAGKDYYIIVNLDRPLELVIYYEQIVALNLVKKMLLLPIHHSYRCIDFYEKNIRTGVFSIPLKLINNHNQREKLKNIARAIKYPKLTPYVIRHYFIDYKRKSQDVINNALAILLIADDERGIIRDDFNVEPKVTYLINNGVDLAERPKLSENAIRDIDVLICGRIEPRKNSIALVNYFKSKELHVAFAGSMNPNAKSYCKTFVELVGESENIEYLGRINPSYMPALYSRAKINLSASWFEVASLVDLEAYAYGCHVISSENGHTKNYLGEKALYISPLNIELLDIILPKCLMVESDKISQYEYIKSNFTWERAGETLIDALCNLKEKSSSL
ncbi:glycosyltransferase, MSMEG_0565 family [Serratia plymuthica]|nr:glycosyltransferase, MSMEG_0565 family [Serratia plymuthica]